MIGTTTASPTRSATTTINLSLATLIIGGWMAVHVVSIFFFEVSAATAWAGPLIIAVQTWLCVGLFIVAHDCMHGSLVPFRPEINRAIGGLCLTLYAGFSYDDINRNHHLHHRHSGTAGDPDFHDEPPHGFWAWYWDFMREYLAPRQLVFMPAVFIGYTALGVPVWNTLLFWALPAILSSFQLFYFGTYLPHRPDADGFADRHRSRTSNFSWVVSLLTCFHFGYHHEHHVNPGLTWWQLPKAHRREA